MSSQDEEPKKFTEGMLFFMEQDIPLPVKKTEVWAQVTGLVSNVRVIQTFHNPYDKNIEAVYVFPLSHNASVHELKMVVGDRVITGEIKEKEEGRRVYEEAKAKGNTASLLEQERPNIFTVSVANIKPAEEILVDIRYHEKLEYKDGEHQFVFPMVVAPRYCPQEEAKEKRVEGQESYTSPPVPDAGRITPPLIPPNFRSGHNINLVLEINAGTKLENITCISHDVDISRSGDEKARISLKNKNEIPNKDFVLTYKTSGDKVKPAFFTYRKKDESGYFLAILTPPEYSEKLIPTPKEMIFVIDRSGSMGGTSIVQARKALKASLRALNPEDSFAIIPFDDMIECFSKNPVPFSQDKLNEADKYIDTIEARGGTEILPAMESALKMTKDPRRLRIVVFLTDGCVGNEEHVLHGVQKVIGNARIYTFGIGSSVNRYLLDKMAQVGKGFVEYIMPNQDIEDAIRKFQDKTAFPVWTDLNLLWEGVHVVDIYPYSIPDLFLGEPVVLTGRFLTNGTGKLTVRGKESEKDIGLTIPLSLPIFDETWPSLPLIWARSRIDHLSDLEREDKSSKARYRDEIISLAIQYRLASQYTSFVAVEKQEKREGESESVEKCICVHMPTELPEGMDYNTLTGAGYGSASAPAYFGGMPGGGASLTQAGGIVSGAAGNIFNMLSAASMPKTSSPKGSLLSSISSAIGNLFASQDKADRIVQKENEEHEDSEDSGAMLVEDDTGETLLDINDLEDGAACASSGAVPTVDFSAASFADAPKIPDMPLDRLIELTLKYLTRIQNAEGSWGEGEERVFLTSLAVTAFAKSGHTDRKGNYQSYLRRAISWLKKQQPTKEQDTLAYFWAMTMLTIKGSIKPSSLDEHWEQIKAIKACCKISSLLQKHCIIEGEAIKLNPANLPVLSPSPWGGVLCLENAEEFFETLLMSLLPENISVAESEIKERLKSNMTLSGDQEGRVNLAFGSIPATIGAALGFCILRGCYAKQ